MVGPENPRARIVLSPEEGEKVWLGDLGVRFMTGGAETGETLALLTGASWPATNKQSSLTFNALGQKRVTLWRW